MSIKLTLLLAVTLVIAWSLSAANPRWRILKRAIDRLHSGLENLQPENFLFYGIFWGANATAVSVNQADRDVYASWMVPYLLDLQADDGSFKNGNLRMVPTIGAALAMAAE